MPSLIRAAGLICIVALVPGASALAVDEPLSLEQQGFDDLAARLAGHLRSTADLLARIRETTDPTARRRELEELERAMQTTERLNLAMHALVSSRASGPMGCAMMRERSAGDAPAPAATPVAPDAGAQGSHH
jgi:hypothetical protein